MVNVIKENKRLSLIVLSGFIVAMFIILVIINVSKAGSDVKIDGDLYISNAQVTTDNGLYTFNGDVYTKSKTLKVESINIIFKDSKNVVKATLHGYINQEIEYGETVKVVAQTDMDVSKMKISYEVKYIADEPEPDTGDSDGEGSGE